MSVLAGDINIKPIAGPCSVCLRRLTTPLVNERLPSLRSTSRCNHTTQRSTHCVGLHCKRHNLLDISTCSIANWADRNAALDFAASVGFSSHSYVSIMRLKLQSPRAGAQDCRAFADATPTRCSTQPCKQTVASVLLRKQPPQPASARSLRTLRI